MTEGKLLMNSGQVKTKQEEMMRQLTLFLNGLYTLSEECRWLGQEWKGEAGNTFLLAFQKEWEKTEALGRELRQLIGIYGEAEQRFTGCEGEIAKLLDGERY